MADKSSPRTRQTDSKNLVWFGEIENLPNYQIINAYLYLPFFLLIILWCRETKHIHYSVLVLWFGIGGLIGDFQH
jgi:hypothetical protein